MKNKLFPYICWLTAITFSLQLQAQNKVSAPMADVNQVIDNINNPFYYRRQSLVNKNFCLRCQRFKISSGCVKQPG